jgi:hypothetical protein
MNFEQREKAKALALLNEKLTENPLNARVTAEYREMEQKRLYVVEFESMNYAGAPSHCLVWATDEEDAKLESESFAEDWYYQEDGDQYLEDNEDDDGVIWSTTTSVVLLESSEFAKFVEDEQQQYAFFKVVNE